MNNGTADFCLLEGIDQRNENWRDRNNRLEIVYFDLEARIENCNLYNAIKKSSTLNSISLHRNIISIRSTCNRCNTEKIIPFRRHFNYIAFIVSFISHCVLFFLFFFFVQFETWTRYCINSSPMCRLCGTSPNLLQITINKRNYSIYFLPFSMKN